MIKDQNIVCIGNTTWFGEYQKSTVQILSRLAISNNILYVDYAFTFKDLISGLLGKKKIPVKQILGFNPRLDLVSINESGKVVKLTLPPVIPFNHFRNEKIFRLILKINSYIIYRSVKNALKKLQMTEVISLTAFMPFYGLYLKGKLKEKLNVYYCYDSIDGKRNGARGKKIENEFMRCIDAVIVTSDHLASEKREINPNLFTIKNGVDFNLFRTATEGLIRPEIPKVVCYTGSIDQRFELEIVEFCISNAPDLDFIFVGPVRNKEFAERLGKYTNVHIKLPVSPEDIPEIMFKSHVGIIPYTRTEQNRNVYPLKINEYLAVGTPVVMTDFARLPEFDQLVSIASDKHSFLSKIRKEIQSDQKQNQLERIRFASKNSWDSRAESFSEVLEILLNKNNC